MNQIKYSVSFSVKVTCLFGRDIAIFVSIVTVCPDELVWQMREHGSTLSVAPTVLPIDQAVFLADIMAMPDIRSELESLFDIIDAEIYPYCSNTVYV